jgi:hypothetical protein
MQAPRGFQPPNVQPQTQANNGGPRGLGQPRKTLKTAINPQTGPAAPSAPPSPPPGQGQPGALYPEPVDPIANAERDLWANRNSRQPAELVQNAFLAFLNRPAAPEETQQLLSGADSIDALVYQLLSLKPAPAQPNLQSAILGR